LSAIAFRGLAPDNRRRTMKPEKPSVGSRGGAGRTGPARDAEDETQAVPALKAPRPRRAIGVRGAAHANLPPSWVLGGAGAAVLLMVSAIAITSGSRDDAAPPAATAVPPIPGAPRVPESSPPERLATIVDRPGRVELDAAGDVSGLPGVSVNVRRQVGEALLAGRLPGGAGPAAGSANVVATGLELLAPLLGERVSDERPRFLWRRAAEAPARVVVEVLDASGVLLAESPSLAGSEWRPPRALPRARPLSWRLRFRGPDGETSRLPDWAAGTAAFSVLREEELAWREREVDASHGSLLVEAVLSAQLGARSEASAALAELARLNPGEARIARLRAAIEDPPEP